MSIKKLCPNQLLISYIGTATCILDMDIYIDKQRYELLLIKLFLQQKSAYIHKPECILFITKDS